MFAKTLKVMMIINVNTNTCTGMSLHDLMMGLLAGYPKLSLWHVDDFQLKTIKAQQTQEELFIPFSTALENLDRGLVPERERERERDISNTNFFHWEAYLHDSANICLPNICSCHLSVNCLPSLSSARPLHSSSLAQGWPIILYSQAAGEESYI